MEFILKLVFISVCLFIGNSHCDDIEPSKDCVIKPCPVGTYLVADTCNICRPPGKPGWPCGGGRICEVGLICNEFNVCGRNITCPEGTYKIIHSDECRNNGQVNDSCATIFPCAKGLFCNDNGICSNPIVDCSTTECPDITSCQEGEYFFEADGLRECCNSCHNYTTYGEKCNRIPCSKDFFCTVEKFCAPKGSPDCGLVFCVPAGNCSIDKYKVKRNGIDVCCDYCDSYSDEGYYCNKKHQCLPGLICSSEKRCEYPPLNCSQVKCLSATSCPPHQYLAKADGVKQCCDSCLNKLALGGNCTGNLPCTQGLYCNADNFCEKIDCTLVDCFPTINCPDGSFLTPRDGIKRCCDSCQKYARKGEYCDADNLCAPELICNNNMC